MNQNRGEACNSVVPPDQMDKQTQVLSRHEEMITADASKNSCISWLTAFSDRPEAPAGNSSERQVGVTCVDNPEAPKDRNDHTGPSGFHCFFGMRTPT